MSYSKAGKKPDKQCAKASKAQGKYAKRHARCGKSKQKSKRHGTITRTGRRHLGKHPLGTTRTLSNIAAANGDATPYDIEAVATTYGQKIEALPNGAHPANEPASTPMYVVTMRGEFAGFRQLRDWIRRGRAPTQCARGRIDLDRDRIIRSAPCPHAQSARERRTAESRDIGHSRRTQGARSYAASVRARSDGRPTSSFAKIVGRRSLPELYPQGQHHPFARDRNSREVTALAEALRLVAVDRDAVFVVGIWSVEVEADLGPERSDPCKRLGAQPDAAVPLVHVVTAEEIRPQTMFAAQPLDRFGDRFQPVKERSEMLVERACSSAERCLGVERPDAALPGRELELCSELDVPPRRPRFAFPMLDLRAQAGLAGKPVGIERIAHQTKGGALLVRLLAANHEVRAWRQLWVRLLGHPHATIRPERCAQPAPACRGGCRIISGAQRTQDLR